MPQTDSISIIIPAYNEQASLLDAVSVAMHTVKSITRDYEIIIVDDGSTDKTELVAHQLALKNKHILVLHHNQNKGFGKTFRDGLDAATKTYVTGYPADNDIFKETFQNLLEARKNNALVSTYMLTMKERETVRQLCSHMYTAIMNILFGLKLTYYNGYFICPLNLIQPIPLKSEGYTLFAEIKIKLLRKGVTLREIPFHYKPRPFGVSKAFSVTNIAQTLLFIPIIVSDIYFRTGRSPKGK